VGWGCTWYRNEMMAGVLFAGTKDYEFLHSAHKVPIFRALEFKVPGMVEYFKSRLQPAINPPNDNQLPLKADNRLHFLKIDESGQRKYEEYGA